MTTFALVHGAWHGSWCWDRLVPLLHTAGHATVAVDLPCEDPSASFEDYADVVVRDLAHAPHDVVLVAHSLAGVTAPLVAVRRPVRRIVYLCSLLPAPRRTLVERLAAEPDVLVPGYRDGLDVDGSGTTRWVDEQLAHAVLYADCDPETAHWAFARLRRQATTAYREPWPLTALPDVPATHVVCTEDRMVDPGWSRRAVRDEFGGTPVELPGGHSPFLSRPEQLAAVLVREQ